MSLPLVTSSGLVGTINVYARARHAFDERAPELGELFSIPAGIAVENAQVLAVAQRLAIRLQVAQEAIGRSRWLSQNSHRKLYDTAQRVVRQAGR